MIPLHPAIFHDPVALAIVLGAASAGMLLSWWRELKRARDRAAPAAERAPKNKPAS